jgi:hypothetical protein
MNHYEVTVSNSLGHVSKVMATFTVHATSPRVALRRVMASKRLQFPVLRVASYEDAMISLSFDVTNQGKVIRISELRWSEATGGKVYTGRHKFHPADSPIPEGWAKVGK